MRVTVVALTFLVGAGAARADSPLEAYAPLKVVGLMPDTSQALLWDEPVAEYRLVKVGDTLEGWKVLEISARDKRVTVGQDDVRDDLALTRLPRPNAMITYATKVVSIPAKPAAAAAAAAAPLPTPVPPTASVAPGPNAPASTDMLAAPGEPAAAESTDPIDPYSAAPAAPAAAPAPAGMPAPVAAPVAAPVGADPADPTAPLDPYAAPAAPTVTTAQPTVIAEGPESNVVVERHVIRRVDLDREINDFDRMMATVQVAPAAGGGFVITRLEPRSFPTALGLRQGDMVRSIAGQPVSNIDDAARVYARLRSASTFVVEVQRASRRLLLRVDIR